jgi:hypothetical protein
VPGAENPSLDLAEQERPRLQALRELQAGGEPMPHPVEELLPWAITDNGDVAYWRTTGDPDAWTVTVNEARGPEWHDYPGGTADFLVAWLIGHERVAVFPDDVPVPGDGFKPAQ